MNATNTNALPVTILTGFLGAGKTTLLNRVLTASHGVRVGVLVNDFGELNIDARLVSAVEGQMVDLSNGCVCCTMQGDLVSSVRKMLLRGSPPEHLIVESSGIADPVGVLAAFSTPALRGATRVHAVLAVVDAVHARDPRLDRQLVEDQIRSADLIALNKADLVGEQEVHELQRWLGGFSSRVPIIRAEFGNIPVDLLFCTPIHSEGPPVSRHLHQHAFSSATFVTECPLAYRRVREALEGLPAGIFRAKGFLYLADAPLMRFVAHRVGCRVTVELDGRWGSATPRTELVFIGERDHVDELEIRIRLQECGTDAIPVLPADNFRALRTRDPVTRSRVSVS